MELSFHKTLIEHLEYFCENQQKIKENLFDWLRSTSFLLKFEEYLTKLSKLSPSFVNLNP